MSAPGGLPAQPLWELLERGCELGSERPAVACRERRVDYGTLRARAAALGTLLRARGVRPGERVAALLPNELELLELYFAAAGVGAALVPLNLRLAPRELALVLADCAPRMLVCDPALVELARAAGAEGRELMLTGPGYEAALDAARAPFEAERVDGDAPAQIYYTSGTTGRAKGVVLTQRNVYRHAQAVIAELALGPRDVWGHFAPMFHLADAWACFALSAVGGRHVMLASFDAKRALERIERERVTLTNLVPTMLNRMVNEPGVREFDLASLRLVLSGGAPIAPELVRRAMQTFGCEYAQTYGLTETSPFLTLGLLDESLRALPPEQQLAWRAKTGRPFRAVELRVVDEAGREVARDGRAVGEVQARGETVTPGYWRRPAETAAAFDDGWLRTGDLATVDERGWLSIVDRKKDVILTGGETVYSTEVENALFEHPAVLEAAAFGQPDEEWGELVAAAVVLRPGAYCDAAELVAHCRARLARYKLPRRIEFVDELPRTGSGKIQKRALRERYLPRP